MNSFGRIFRVSIFGESHGESVGIVVDGCPAGMPLTVEDFLPDLEKRKGGTQKGTTPRQEEDLPIFKSGIFNDKTTGAPITILFENKNIRSGDYEKQRDVPRPGHADFVAHKKFAGFEDYRGSGHFSGRLTVALVAAGVVAKKVLEYAQTSPQTPLQRRGVFEHSDLPGYITNTTEQWKLVSDYAKENRQNPTKAEELLWQELRNRKIKNSKFRRQHAIEGYIADFVCLEQKLVVEVDGGYHNEEDQKKLDDFRTKTLQKNGYRLIRFTNEDVLQKLDWVLGEIGKLLKSETSSPSPLERESEGEVFPPIRITSSILEIGGETDLEKGLQKAIDEKDSIGGIIECRVSGLPIGLGEPFFDSAESLLSHIVFAIPAVRGIEFGTGFAAARMFGSEHNDAIENMEGKTRTNHAGGIVGGLTNGNELVFRIVIKPTSSTPKEQNTLNWETGKIENVSVKGRHDLCIALRVPVILEAVTAIVLADLMMLEQKISRIIS
ncbi:MAG TPA: chorismate synthase [Chitinophagaceae bacterium]|jgi:chorismate synthase|nr:chorismate synthase [Chitinophagaceae bacterium]